MEDEVLLLLNEGAEVDTGGREELFCGAAIKLLLLMGALFAGLGVLFTEDPPYLGVFGADDDA
jgi:hypothetical protein